MTNFALLSTIVTLAALFGLISHRLLKLPTSVGAIILSLVTATALLAGGHFMPAIPSVAQNIVGRIDFNEVVLHGMLAFLLFGGALQLDLTQLLKEKASVLSLAIVSTGLSIVFVAALFHYALPLLGLQISLLGALLFGALISPTDPVAVLDMLRRVGAPPQLEAQLAGESLFNDGIGAVIFLALLGAIANGAMPSAGHFALSLLLEAGGGLALGCLLGFITYRLLLLLDSHRIEITLTLALAMGGYALADALHLSAPLEVVAAGLFVNGRAKQQAMSESTRAHVDRFWEFTEDIMNVVLFLLLGLELLVLPSNARYFFAGLLAIPIVLLARWCSVSLTVRGLALLRPQAKSNITVLTWGGLRGGLAVALALSLPQNQPLARGLLMVTYVVVVFSILVQGLTLVPLMQRLNLQGYAQEHKPE